MTEHDFTQVFQREYKSTRGLKHQHPSKAYILKIGLESESDPGILHEILLIKFSRTLPARTQRPWKSINEFLPVQIELLSGESIKGSLSPMYHNPLSSLG